MQSTFLTEDQWFDFLKKECSLSISDNHIRQVAQKCDQEALDMKNWLDYYNSGFWEKMGVPAGQSPSVVDGVGRLSQKIFR